MRRVMGSFKWLTESNRWKHLVLAICIGLWANSWYCAEYTGIGIASALEFKDKQYGNKWDWIDWLCTVAGATIGYAVRYILSTNIQ